MPINNRPFFGISFEGSLNIHKLLFYLPIFLSLVGLVFIFESSSITAFDDFGNSFYFFNRQFIWLIIAIFVMIATSLIDYRFWLKYSFFIMIFSLLGLIVVLFPEIGAKVGGARRWIDMGIFSIQPSEIVKLASVLYLTTFLTEKKVQKHAFPIFAAFLLGSILIQDFNIGLKTVFFISTLAVIYYFINRSEERQRLLSFVFLVASIIFFIIRQPDMGTAITITGLLIGTYFLTGKHTKEIIIIIFVGIVLGTSLILVAPYRRDRITAFMNPKADPLGKTYHINQILIGVSSGGLTGRGLFQSRQKYTFLPEAHTDSIFAIISEETGLVGGFILMSSYLLMLWILIQIIHHEKNHAASILVGSYFCLLGIQSVINLGGMVNLLPLTGIPLPFFSYGGTSLLTFFFLNGIALNISNQNRTR